MKAFEVVRKFHWFLICCTTIVVAQNPAPKTFHINIQVEDLKSPAKVILTIWEVNQWAEYSAESTGNEFVLTGSLKEPSFAYLVMKYGEETDKQPRLGNITQLYIGNSPVTVHTKDSLNVAVIKGGHLEEELELLNKITKEWKAAGDAKETVLADFIKKHPSSFVSLHAIRNASMDRSFSIDADKTEPLFELLSPEIKNTASGKELGKSIAIARRTAIGSVAPDFIQTDTLGGKVELKALRGNYVLIDFWASWCKPCRKENPMLVKTYNEFKDKNFMIIGVSLDNNRSSWAKAIRKDNLTWKHTSDLKFWKNAVAIQYGVQTVPQNFLLDPSGKIIGKNIPSDELGSWLKGVVH